METTFCSVFDEAVFTKIRVNFLFNHPFLSVLALSIPTRFETNTKSAFQTDAHHVSIDLEKLSRYGEQEITYLYAHTLLHVALKHPYRRQAREEGLWNLACDTVVNLILSSFDNVGVRPEDEILDFDLKDKCVEEVYEILYQKEEEQKETSASSPSKDQEKLAQTSPQENGAHKAYQDHKRDIENVQENKHNAEAMQTLDGIIIQALSLAKKSHKSYHALYVEIDTLLSPDIALEETLKEYLTLTLFEKNPTFSRPNRRYIHSDLYLPGEQKSHEMLEVSIALDCSSSVTQEEYRAFLGVIKEVCESFYEYKITVLPFDTCVRQEHVLAFDSFHPIQEQELLIPKSNGGTDFDQVLAYLEKTTLMHPEHLLMVLSDGEFEITRPLCSQTLFLISAKKNIEKLSAYGRVIQFKL